MSVEYERWALNPVFLTGGNEKTRGRCVVQTVKPAISQHPGPLANDRGPKYKHASFYNQENGVETFGTDWPIRSFAQYRMPALWGGGGGGEGKKNF